MHDLDAPSMARHAGAGDARRWASRERHLWSFSWAATSFRYEPGLPQSDTTQLILWLDELIAVPPQDNNNETRTDGVTNRSLEESIALR